MNEKLTVFILTHGRPNNIITIKTLRKHGYTGEIYFIVDDMDATKDEYISLYGDNVKIFDKKKIGETFDRADNFDEYRTITYARNACFQIARDLDIKYFIQLDDDYTNFRFVFDDKRFFNRSKINNLDKIFEILLNFYIKNNKVSTIAMLQGGDLVGGYGNILAQKIQLKRKSMNSFICSTDRQFKFIGTMNEDVNTYTLRGSRGLLFLTTNLVMLDQMATQTNEGGITDMYKKFGTYVKSFYTIIHHPSSVTINMMGNNKSRLHHKINYKKTVPRILRADLKKA